MAVFVPFTPSICVGVHGGGYGESVIAVASVAFAARGTLAECSQHGRGPNQASGEYFTRRCNCHCIEWIGRRGGPCEAGTGLCSTAASGGCRVYLDRMLHRGQRWGHLGE